MKANKARAPFLAMHSKILVLLTSLIRFSKPIRNFQTPNDSIPNSQTHPCATRDNIVSTVINTRGMNGGVPFSPCVLFFLHVAHFLQYFLLLYFSETQCQCLASPYFL